MRAPKYRLHKPTGKAVVTIHGKDIYLGLFDSPESHVKYHQVVSAYLTSGGSAPSPQQQADMTIKEGFQRYQLVCAGEIKRKEERWHFLKVIEIAIAFYGDRRLGEFGPIIYDGIRGQFVKKGWSRSYVNKQTGRLKMVLRWLVSKEMYAASRLADVREVPDLRKGRTTAPETSRVRGVEDEVVLATLPHLPRAARGVALLQWWTGCRPSEAIQARREHINTEGIATLPMGKTIKLEGVWVYQPPDHKGAWAGRERYVLIGPKGQADLATYLEGKGEADFLFSPKDDGGRARAGLPGDTYLTTSYARAIAKASKKAGVAHWFPYQLRHRFASVVRDHFSENHAKEVLGHSHLEMTDHYCGVGLEKAAEAIRKIG